MARQEYFGADGKKFRDGSVFVVPAALVSKWLTHLSPIIKAESKFRVPASLGHPHLTILNFYPKRTSSSNR